jgi:nicotinamidase/pyrazinamidase
LKTVFFDVDTQLDFMVPAGALYVPGAERLVPYIAALTDFARQNGYPILSTVDTHLPDDPEFATWKPHCVIGTAGQQKLSSSLLQAGQYKVPSAPGVLETEVALEARQVLVEKEHVNCFANPNLEHLLDVLGVDRFVVYGLATEVCVLEATRGLLRKRKVVELVTDAICALSEKTGASAVRDLIQEGARPTTTAQVTTRSVHV